jgi:hypothetical protein
MLFLHTSRRDYRIKKHIHENKGGDLIGSGESLLTAHAHCFALAGAASARTREPKAMTTPAARMGPDFVSPRESCDNPHPGYTNGGAGIRSRGKKINSVVLNIDFLEHYWL